MLRDAHKLIAETEVGKQEYLDIYPDLPHEKIEILFPLFDTDEFEPIPVANNCNKFGIREDKIILLAGCTILKAMIF